MSTVATATGTPPRAASDAPALLETGEFADRAELQPARAIVAEAPAPAKPPRRSSKRSALLLVLALLLLGGGTVGAVFWMISRNYESTDDATVEARVIAISPQVAARVKSVHVADNALVHKNDVLVELDPTDYQVALEQASASRAAADGRLAQAVAQVDSANASRDQSRAEVAVAEANAQMAASDHDRYEEARKSNAGSISKQQLDNATGAWLSTEAQLKQARAKLAAAEAQIATAKAAVQGAQGDLAKAAADVHRAEVNLSYCTIKASEDGRITKKNVEPGSYVQAGQSLFAIVPSDYWIVANFKETQLDRVRPGQRVQITVDAYPQMNYTGTVESIQSGTGSRFSVLPAENATGNYVKVVQRVPVKIVLDPGQTDDLLHPLAPGMSAVPEVKVR